MSKKTRLQQMYDSRWLYLFLLPAVVYIFVFKYIPIWGVQIAFRNYIPGRAILASPWVGLKHITRFVQGFYFNRVMVNTLLLSFYNIVFTFPLPIILAIGLHYIELPWLKKGSQMITYMPYFISTVVMVGIILVFLSPRTGPINILFKSMGREPIFFMGDPAWFRSIFILSGVWQFSGYNAIIYIAVLAGVSPELHESAIIDGAGKFRRILHIDIPTIMPTMSILLVMRLGRTLQIGFEKAFALQNSLNLSTSEIIATYVYKVGLEQAKFSYAAAIGLFLNIINFTILLIANRTARKLTNNSLF